MDGARLSVTDHKQREKEGDRGRQVERLKGRKHDEVRLPGRRGSQEEARQAEEV